MSQSISIYLKHFYILYSRYKLNSFFTFNKPQNNKYRNKRATISSNIILFTGIKSAKDFIDYAISFLQTELNEINIKETRKAKYREIIFSNHFRIKPKFFQ